MRSEKIISALARQRVTSAAPPGRKSGADAINPGIARYPVFEADTHKSGLGMIFSSCNMLIIRDLKPDYKILAAEFGDKWNAASSNLEVGTAQLLESSA